MSYYNAKKSYEAEKQESQDFKTYICTSCLMEASYSDMATYGARCWKCYDEYCKSAPRYEPQPTFTGDSKDWARRILHKEKEGLPVSKIAVQFAKEALKII
jgi:cytochrome c5